MSRHRIVMRRQTPEQEAASREARNKTLKFLALGFVLIIAYLIWLLTRIENRDGRGFLGSEILFIPASYYFVKLAKKRISTHEP